MKRKIYKDLLNWKENSINIPLEKLLSNFNKHLEKNKKSTELCAQCFDEVERKY